MKMKATISVLLIAGCPFNPYPIGRRGNSALDWN